MSNSNIDCQAVYECSTDSKDLLENVSDMLSFVLESIAANEESSGFSDSGTAGLCHTLEHCRDIVRLAASLP